MSPQRKMDRVSGSGANMNLPVKGTEAQTRMAWEPSGTAFFVWQLRRSHRTQGGCRMMGG